MHVPPPVDAGEKIPCACLVQASASGRQQHGKPSKRLVVVSVIDAVRPVRSVGHASPAAKSRESFSA